MIDAWREGVGSIGQACNLVILAPMVMLVVAARGRWPAVVGAVAGVALGGWVFAARWLVPGDVALRVTALFVMLVFGAFSLSAIHRGLPGPVVRVAERVDAPGVSIAVSALVGMLVVQWWRPCVGEELGEILTRAPGEPFTQLLPAIAFMIGLSLPLIVVGLVGEVWRPQPATAARVGAIAAAVGVLLATSVIAGQHGEIVARLFEWSQ